MSSKARVPFTLVVLFSASFAAAVPSGRFFTAPDGRSPGEAVRIPDEVVDRLVAARFEETVRIPDWPIAAGVRGAVSLVRHDVYAPDAKLYEVGPAGPVEVPRSRWLFFWGAVESVSGGRALVIVDPDDRSIRGQADGPDGLAELRADGRETLVAPMTSFLPEEVREKPSWSCGQESLPPSPHPEVAPESASPMTPTALVTATIAVDTDNELMLQKFGDNVTNATNYVAQLIAAMTTGYERDLNVRLLQGTTYYRVSSVADPWTGGTGNADSTKLNEFSSYWNTNYGGVSRALAMLLSGKQSSANSSSGIAWINGLCSKSIGYSFSQVFKYSGSTGSSDNLVVGHENGHNFGSKHTHCYTPPIDNCYSGESNCYSGATSCPAAQTIGGIPNVKGTWMSYCHILGGGCTSSNVFHPTTVTLLNGIVNTKIGNCIFNAATVQEASPGSQLRVSKGGGTSSTTLTLSYSAACGSTGHTVNSGSILTLPGPIVWTGRTCGFDASGTANWNVGVATDQYFVVTGFSGSNEGSYGKSSAGTELPVAQVGTCSYTQVLGGTCP